MVIRRVNPVSAAKVCGILYAILGLIVGALVSLMMMAAGGAMSAAAEETGGAVIGMMMGAGAIIVMPIFYGIIGFISGLVGSLLYNLVAGWTGGLEVEVT
jgi:hypothetical protein